MIIADPAGTDYGSVMKTTSIGALGALVVAAWAGASASAGAPPPFKPGEVIEYRVRSEYPNRWAKGKFIKALPGGKQYLIHEEPSEFFPEGSEAAREIKDVRRPQPVAAPPAADPAPTPDPAPRDPDRATAAEPKAQPMPGAADARGTLSREDVLAFARKAFGGQNPWKEPLRERALAQIRDHIKAHGTNFKMSAVGDKFYDQLNKEGFHSVHIFQAVNDNFGAHPKLEDYFGTFLLRASNRGSNSVRQVGGELKKITTDLQAESGRLTINKDGTYVWEVLRGAPGGTVLRGKWRQSKPDEMMPTEGGIALWLENAKGGDEYMVRMDREPGYADWINVGAGKGRTPVEYGRRAR